MYQLNEFGNTWELNDIVGVYGNDEYGFIINQNEKGEFHLKYLPLPDNHKTPVYKIIQPDIKAIYDAQINKVKLFTFGGNHFMSITHCRTTDITIEINRINNAEPLDLGFPVAKDALIKKS